MGRRLVGRLMFLGAAVDLVGIAGRLASEQRAGWGWFLFTGMVLSGVAVNLWTGEIPTHRCPDCQKPRPDHCLEY